LRRRGRAAKSDVGIHRRKNSGSGEGAPRLPGSGGAICRTRIRYRTSLAATERRNAWLLRKRQSIDLVHGRSKSGREAAGMGIANG
jgi:hypothetical protein